MMSKPPFAGCAAMESACMSRIRSRFKGSGPYNRILGEVFVGHQNVNLEMIEIGHAEAYRGKRPKGFDVRPYQKAEKKAKRAMIGIWSFVDNYLSPKDRRRMQRVD